MKKRIAALALAFAMVLGTAALAAGAEKSVTITPMSLKVNGLEVTPTKSDGTAADVFSYEGATYAPLRYLSELLGIEVEWDKNDPNSARLVNVPNMPSAPKAALSFKAGTYAGEAQGNNAPVKVEVTVSADAITDVKVTEQAETPSIAGPALERLPKAIVDGQTLTVDTVTGATNTSKAILAAVEKALVEAGGNAEELKRAGTKVESPVSDQALKADVVVLGAGGAGLSAALEAKDQGAGTVILLEKMASIGGTTFTSQGLIGGYDSKLQKSKGVELTFEQMYDNLMSNASYHLDQALTTVTLKKSGETVDWLADRVKLDINDVKVGYGPLQMMHTVNGGGAAMAVPFEAALKDAGVEVMLETRATELITDSTGAVVGVRAQGKGANVEIEAKSVVIATGGYAYNPELTARLTPELAGTWGVGFPGSTGDGIIMASNVGAALTHTDDMMCVLKDYTIMSEHNGTSNSANNNGFMSLPNMIMVGKAGKRFVNEKDQGYMTQKLNAPIFDQMHKDQLGYVWAISDQAAVDATNGKTKRNLDLSYVTGDTIEEFAANLGVDAENLKATIDNFNAYVDAGYDQEFRRNEKEMAKLTAPYVAIPLVPCEIITYGGVARNDKAEVIRADGSSIPGLFVAGEASANSAYMGFTLTNCFAWGRIAGESAAAYAK